MLVCEFGLIDRSIASQVAISSLALPTPILRGQGFLQARKNSLASLDSFLDRAIEKKL